MVDLVYLFLGGFTGAMHVMLLFVFIIRRQHYFVVYSISISISILTTLVVLASEAHISKLLITVSIINLGAVVGILLLHRRVWKTISDWRANRK